MRETPQSSTESKIEEHKNCLVLLGTGDRKDFLKVIGIYSKPSSQEQAAWEEELKSQDIPLELLEEIKKALEEGSDKLKIKNQSYFIAIRSLSSIIAGKKLDEISKRVQSRKQEEES